MKYNDELITRSNNADLKLGISNKITVRELELPMSCCTCINYSSAWPYVHLVN